MECIYLSLESLTQFPFRAPLIEGADCERHFPDGSHIVVYLVTDRAVFIQRVVHARNYKRR